MKRAAASCGAFAGKAHASVEASRIAGSVAAEDAVGQQVAVQPNVRDDDGLPYSRRSEKDFREAEGARDVSPARVRGGFESPATLKAEAALGQLVLELTPPAQPILGARQEEGRIDAVATSVDAHFASGAAQKGRARRDLCVTKI